MNSIKPELLRAFWQRLVALDVRSDLFQYYEKWLRHFLDFKDGCPCGLSADAYLDAYEGKLLGDQQTRRFRLQALQAARIGLELLENQAMDQLQGYGAGYDDFDETVEAEQNTNDSPGAVLNNWQAVNQAMRAEIALRHYSPKTKSAYLNWLKRFAAFVGSKPIAEIDAGTARDFLTKLAVTDQVAASTQNQAFNALLFLFRHVLKRDYELGDTVTRAKTSKYIPTVLTRGETDKILRILHPPYDLIVGVLYGCGLRLAECLSLRVNALDFDQNLVIIHDGKGNKDRSVPLPLKLRAALERAVSDADRQLEQDMCVPEFAGVFLPKSVANKSAAYARQLGWQWLFPAKELTLVPEEGVYRRYHNYPNKVSIAIRSAVNKAKLTKRVTAHTFRHTFASHLLQANVDIRTIQQLLGHSDIRTTMIYTHTIPSRTLKEMVSPLDVMIG